MALSFLSLELTWAERNAGKMSSPASSHPARRINIPSPCRVRQSGHTPLAVLSISLHLMDGIQAVRKEGICPLGKGAAGRGNHWVPNLLGRNLRQFREVYGRQIRNRTSSAH